MRRVRDSGTAARTDSVRTPSGQSGSLRGLKLVPSKGRPLVPSTSPHQVLRKREPLGAFLRNQMEISS